jgi:predicted phage tail protein
MTLDDTEAVDVRGLAAVISARIVADAWVTKAHAFAWLCGGAAIAVCLAALGAAAAFYGYSRMISNKPAAEQTAKAIADALERAEWRTTVSGNMTLAPNTELRLAQGQSV